jgi:hypothetical protein
MILFINGLSHSQRKSGRLELDDKKLYPIKVLPERSFNGLADTSDV